MIIWEDLELPIRALHISGPAVDRLENRKETDNGPTEEEVTENMSAWWKTHGEENCRNLKRILQE